LLQLKGSVGRRTPVTSVPRDINTMTVEQLREWATKWPTYVQHIHLNIPSINLKSSPNYECRCSHDRPLGKYTVKCVSRQVVTSCLAENTGNTVLTGMRFEDSKPVGPQKTYCKHPIPSDKNRPPIGSTVKVKGTRKGRCCTFKVEDHATGKESTTRSRDHICRVSQSRRKDL